MGHPRAGKHGKDRRRDFRPPYGRRFRGWRAFPPVNWRAILGRAYGTNAAPRKCILSPNAPALDSSGLVQHCRLQPQQITAFDVVKRGVQAAVVFILKRDEAEGLQHAVAGFSRGA